MAEQLAICGVTVSSVRFFYDIVQSYDPGSSLFSWHPTCMILAQILALVSILLFKYIPRPWRVTIHGLIAGLSTCIFAGGLYAIYQNKINLQKSHFTSWHGLFGISTVGLMVGQSIFGTLLKYGKKLLESAGIAKLTKVTHRYNGVVTLTLSFLVVMLVTGDWIYLATVAVPSTLLATRLLLKTKVKDKSKRPLKNNKELQ